MMNRLKALMCGAILACAGAAGGSAGASAQELTMAVWGGGGANTWREAFIKQLKADIQEAQDSVVATQERELREAAEETPTGEVEPQP